MGLSSVSVVRHLGFLKLNYRLPVLSRNPLCVILSINVVEIGHTVGEIFRVFLVKSKTLPDGRAEYGITFSKLEYSFLIKHRYLNMQ